MTVPRSANTGPHATIHAIDKRSCGDKPPNPSRRCRRKTLRMFSKRLPLAHQHRAHRLVRFKCSSPSERRTVCGSREPAYAETEPDLLCPGDLPFLVGPVLTHHYGNCL